MPELDFSNVAAKLGIAKISGVSFELLNDGDRIMSIMREISDEMQWQRRTSEALERFEGQGITAAIVLGASLFGIHTWPEHGRARFNIELCSDSDRSNLNGFPELLFRKFSPTELFFEEYEDKGMLRLVKRQLIAPQRKRVQQLPLNPIT